MDLDRGRRDDVGGTSPQRASDSTIMAPRIAPDGDPVDPPHDAVIGPGISTPLLRLCTALATRARVDLLTAGRHAASDELEQVLGTLGSWEGARVIDPDQTMVVLAAASLQDLAERLPSSSRSTLGVQVESALRLLHTLMQRTRIDAMA
ncbi:hypothetical protein [Brachybacterium sp. FME24]|uniref:hypothetical protein n=1 Tax=Brachybacterium sp. FME24 TaxID=2742605 RepID=UPI00186951F9|nr:hypothetical protein [Brachybacterium sp. FME24]